jgi:hypothetical protein
MGGSEVFDDAIATFAWRAQRTKQDRAYLAAAHRAKSG